MPGIDFAAVRARVSMEDVLALLGFRPLRSGRNQLRGRCPFGCDSSRRTFVAYLETQSYYCFSCHRWGNPLKLWADVRKLDIDDGTRDLCHRLGIQVPLIQYPLKC